MDRVGYKSTMVHIPFYREDFTLIVEKGKWFVLSYLVAKELPGMRISPPGVKEDRDRRTRL